MFKWDRFWEPGIRIRLFLIGKSMWMRWYVKLSNVKLHVQNYNTSACWNEKSIWNYVDKRQQVFVANFVCVSLSVSLCAPFIFLIIAYLFWRNTLIYIDWHRAHAHTQLQFQFFMGNGQRDDSISAINCIVPVIK